MLAADTPFYFFGSHNSQDKDVLLECADIPDKQTAHLWIQDYKATQQVDWNINLITVQHGQIVNTIPSKATIDGVNNALLYTYALHEQKFPLPILHSVKRHLLLNTYRCIRTVLTFCTRTQYRSQIRPTLNGIHPFAHKIKSLQIIDFKEINSFEAKYTADVNIWKAIAFYLGQTLALWQGIEIYTKDDLVKHFPAFEKFIYRQELAQENIQYLQQMKDLFVEKLQEMDFQNTATSILSLGEEKINMDLEIAIA